MVSGLTLWIKKENEQTSIDIIYMYSKKTSIVVKLEIECIFTVQ